MMQRVATGLGILAAGILVWFAMASRTVSSEEFTGRLHGRIAELHLQRTRGVAADPEMAKRLAMVVVIGARIRDFEYGEEGTGSALAIALNRRHLGEDAGAKFSAADRDMILPHVDLRLSVAGFDLLEPSERDAALADKLPVNEISFVRDYLSLVVSQAADRGDEQGTVMAFEALTNLSYDALGSSDLILKLCGSMTLSAALTSAKATERVAAEHVNPFPIEWFEKTSVEKLLEVVSSPEGRKRLVAAIERAEGQLPTARQVVLSGFLGSVDAMGQLVDLEHGPGNPVPRARLEDLEALIEWQDKVLAMIDEPGFVAKRSAFAEAKSQATKLPSMARSAATTLWGSIAAFKGTQVESSRVKRWILSGKVD